MKAICFSHIGPRDGHVVQAHPAGHQAPRLGGAPTVALRDLGQGQVVMRYVTLRVEPAVEPHFRALASGNGLELGDTAKADDIGPEFVRDLEVAHVEHQVVDAARWLWSVGHECPPLIGDPSGR
jgi:hypothetical protein